MTAGLVCAIVACCAAVVIIATVGMNSYVRLRKMILDNDKEDVGESLEKLIDSIDNVSDLDSDDKARLITLLIEKWVIVTELRKKTKAVTQAAPVAAEDAIESVVESRLRRINGEEAIA